MARVRCDACGAVSRLTDLYVREAGMQREDELHCPACQHPKGDDKPLPGWPAAALAGGLLIYWLFFDRAAWPPFLLLLFPALTILHELLHALPAWLLGARVLEIHVGSGQRPAWRLGGVRVAITNWLVGGGFCAFAFRHAPVATWKQLLVVGLPLAFHGASAATLLHTGMPQESDATALQMFALINAFIFAVNLYPADWTDGHHLFRFLRRKDWADTMSYAALAGPAEYALEDGRREDALAEARAVERWMPHPALGAALYGLYFRAGAFDDAERFVEYAGYEIEPVDAKAEQLLRTHGFLVGEPAQRLGLVSLRCYQDRFAEARVELERWLEEEPRAEIATIARGFLAMTLIELDDIGEAERAGRDAFECMPWLPLVKLVYGAVLVAKGAFAGGVEQLKDIGAPYDMSAAAWRAVGLAALGRDEEARAALAAAREGIGAPKRLLARAERAVEA